MSESLDSDGLLDIPFHGRSVEPLYKEIAKYQQLLDEGNLSDEDRAEFVASLDQRWPYMNQTLKISGKIWIPEYQNEDDSSPEMVMHLVENIEVESLGFGSLITGSDNGGSHTRAIGHYLSLDAELMIERPMERIFRSKQVFARPEDIAIDYPFTDETEDWARLSYFFEETIADIDDAFINADNESEVVKALGNIEFPLRSDDTIDELKLIKKYINSHLEFDRKVPYLLDYEGFCYAANELGNLLPAHATADTVMAYALGIEILSFSETMSDGTVDTGLSFGLRVEILQDTKENDTGKQYVIPINDAFKMKSMRPYLAVGLKSSLQDS